MNEFELKFQVPPERMREVETAIRRQAGQPARLRARYYDTADEALARNRLTLRIRQEGRSRVQTAKGPGDGGFDRLEHNVPLQGRASADPDLRRHRGHPVHALLEHALQKAEGPLQPVFETDVERFTRTVRASGTEIEIAFDRGEVRAGGRSQPILELEFELKTGSPVALVECAQGWCEAHGLWLDPLTKSGLGRRLANGIDEAPATGWPGVRESGSGFLAAALDGALQQVLGNARELAAGRGGDSHVHQLRVGIRRLRTAVGELMPPGAWEPLPEQVDEALHGTLFSALGAHRDRSTLLPALMRELAPAGSPMREWQPPLPDVGAAARDPAVQSALLSLVALVQLLRTGDAPGRRQIRALARERLEHLHHKTLREGRRFEQLTEQERHKVRKRLKRLRYLAELVRPLFHRKPVDAYVDALKELQDALGRYQDVAAGRALLVTRAAEDAGAWFGVGWLAAREHELAAECAQACRRTLRRAKPFWD